MSDRTCAISGCTSPVVAREWCEAHYRRWWNNGDPLVTRRAVRAARYDARDGLKLCSGCGQCKPVSEYSVSRARRDDLQHRCKACLSVQQKALRPRKRASLTEDERKARRREYDRTRREARAQQGKAWRTPERSRELVARRRALKLAAPQGDPVLRREYEEIIRRDPCVYCGAPAEHADHIRPLVSGGWEAWFNLAPACRSCNSRKHTRDLLTFLMVREQPSRRAARAQRKG